MKNWWRLIRAEWVPTGLRSVRWTNRAAGYVTLRWAYEYVDLNTGRKKWRQSERATTFSAAGEQLSVAQHTWSEGLDLWSLYREATK